MNCLMIDGKVKYLKQGTTKNGTAWAMFQISNTSYTGEGANKKTVYYNVSCKAWGRHANDIAGNVSDGDTVTVIGHMTNETFTDKDGIEKKKDSCIVDQMYFTRNAVGQYQEEPEEDEGAPF